jgi:integrase
VRTLRHPANRKGRSAVPALDVVLASSSAKKRAGAHVVLTDEGLFAALSAGKPGADPTFTPADSGTWGKSHQLRPMLEACARARIKPAISFHVLRHIHGSALAIRGVPMGVIAEQLGHADTRMTEKHYAHLAPSYVADTIRTHFPTLGIAEDDGRGSRLKKCGGRTKWQRRGST